VDAAGAAVTAVWNAVVARLRRRVATAVALTVAWLVTAAHVGTNDAFYDGMAGGYPVRVTVRMPGVIPGQAQITVRVLQGEASRVLAQAAQWNVGTRGAPAPEPLARVDGERAVWTGPLWLMTRTSYLVNVRVEGAAGAGTASVPVVAGATTRLGMPRWMGALLAVLGAALVAGLVTLVGAAVREGVVEPGELPDRRRRRAARLATSVAAGVAALALLGGSRWWGAVDRDYERYMLRPLASRAEVRAPAGGAPTLRFVVTDSTFFSRRLTPLIPDHGKLMHLFAIRADGGALAHLHPTRLDSATFDAPLPPLPTGEYRLYADVVHESGLARTLVATARVEAGGGARPATPGGASDGDDAWLAGAPAAGDQVALGDGLTMTRETPGPFVAGRDTTLRFVVRDEAGAVVELEPYMGMGGHAMVQRDDGGVFVHLHPMGTVSMAAQERLLRRERGDTALHGADQPAAAHAAHGGAHAAPVTYPGALGFPLAFPAPGRYRVWVQVRRGARVRTAPFTVEVRAA
jgi:hypothetical protein